MELVQVIAQNIQNLLDKHKVSISELSAYLGISRQTLTNYLKTTSTIDSVQLVKIANYFDVPAEYLLHNHSDGKFTMLFRSALHYEAAVEEVEDRIENYLQEYASLARRVGKKISFLPEQYNLSVNYQNKVIDINFECQDYTAPKLDEMLEQEIFQIADEQRRLLGLAGMGAISLIPALWHRGINVLFLDMGTSDISGLSICDEGYGCFIIVNSNEKISVERQLFTAAHEYGHIVLHRPIYKRKIRQSEPHSKKKNLLDSMADCFASRLLCPPNQLQPYAEELSYAKGDLNKIVGIAIPIKVQMQISLQSVMMGLKRYGMIPAKTVSEFYAFLNRAGISKQEPIAIRDNDVLFKQFSHEKDAPILSMLRRLNATDTEMEQKLRFFLGYNHKRAQDTLSVWKKESDMLHTILQFDN